MEILTKQDLSDAASGTGEKILKRSFQSTCIYLDICHLTRRNVYKYAFGRQLKSVDISEAGYQQPIDFGGFSAKMRWRLD